MSDATARFKQAHAENLANEFHLAAHLAMALGYLIGANLPGCSSALAIAWERSGIGGLPEIVAEAEGRASSE